MLFVVVIIIMMNRVTAITQHSIFTKLGDVYKSTERNTFIDSQVSIIILLIGLQIFIQLAT